MNHFQKMLLTVKKIISSTKLLLQPSANKVQKAISLYEAGNYLEAKNILEKCVSFENARAAFVLGMIYYDSDSKEIREKSINLFERADELGSSDAQYALFQIYSGYSVIKPDPQKALHFLNLAADQFHTDALQVLGKIYIFGYLNLDRSLPYLFDPYIIPPPFVDLPNIFPVTANIKLGVHFLWESINQRMSSEERNADEILNDLCLIWKIYEGIEYPNIDKKYIYWKGFYRRFEQRTFLIPSEYPDSLEIEYFRILETFKKLCATDTCYGAKLASAMLAEKLKDYAVAEDAYIQCAKWCIATAALSLGKLYYDGKGVSKDDSKSYFLFNLEAIISGNKEAVKLREKLSETLSEIEIRDAERLSFQFVKDAKDKFGYFWR